MRPVLAMFRLVVPPGGIVVFSVAHLHSLVPATSGYTRVSMDFRTVHDLFERVDMPPEVLQHRTFTRLN